MKRCDHEDRFQGVFGCTNGCLACELERITVEARQAREINAEHDACFDLRWRADMRAIKLWQEAHPGRELVWPDHADLCIWLLEQLDSRDDKIVGLKIELESAGR